jgi:hypothetical protein
VIRSPDRRPGSPLVLNARESSVQDLECKFVAKSHGRVRVGEHSLLPDDLRLRDRLDPRDREKPFVFAVGMDVGAVQVWDLCELGIGEALRLSGGAVVEAKSETTDLTM